MHFRGDFEVLVFGDLMMQSSKLSFYYFSQNKKADYSNYINVSALMHLLK